MLTSILLGIVLGGADAASATTEAPVTIVAQGKVLEVPNAVLEGEDLLVPVELAPKITGFESKARGMCSKDVCLPYPREGGWRRTMADKPFLNVSKFAAKTGQPIAVSEDKAVWSFGTVPLDAKSTLGKGLAPDFELPDREGNKVRLSDFRGKKVLLLTWASW